MKTFLFSNCTIGIRLIKTLVISLLVWACTDSNITPTFNPSTSAAASRTDLPDASLASNYNLQVILRGQGSKALGLIKFRQYRDESQMIHLGVWVHDLQPNTNYILQRAVDTNLDGNCTGTNWLTLGQGLTPKSIVTDDKGSGDAELFRSVAAIPVGSTFDIHFQILKEGTTMVVMSSDCYQYTVH